MHRYTSHLRSLLVALAVLALSAGVVLAARPAAVDSTTTTKSVTVQTEDPTTPGVDEDAEEDVPEVDVDADDATEVDEDADQEGAAKTLDPADAPTTDTATRKQNHGWFVSQAAKAATAAAIAGTATATHGQTVSAVAQSDLGKPEAATAAAAGKAHKPAKSD